MRVLIVNTNRKADLMTAPPIGLCYVATATRSAGHEVRGRGGHGIGIVRAQAQDYAAEKRASFAGHECGDVEAPDLE
jgi:hypothetical protein